MATIFDIAKKAGVSITTVSRALNGYSDVNEKTRQHIMAIAEELNYYPSAAARSLQGKKTNTIAFAPLLNQHVEAEPFFKEFTGVMALACFKHDLSLLVALVDTTRNVEEIYRELAGTGRVDGIVLSDIKPVDERINLLLRLGIPFVAFGRTTGYADLNYPFVDVDGVAGLETVVDYLYKKGHRRLAYLSGPLEMSYAFHRYEGFLRGLKSHELHEDKRLVIGNLQLPEQAYAAIKQIFSLPAAEQPTALVAGSDDLALHVIQAVSDNGREVGSGPDQIAVTGFDDLPFAAYLQPGLTTLRQPITTTCTALLELLVGMLKNKDELAPVLPELPGMVRVGPKQVLLIPELICRESA